MPAMVNAGKDMDGEAVDIAAEAEIHLSLGELPYDARPRTWMSALNTLSFHACLVRAYRSGPALLEFICGDCTQSKLGGLGGDSDLVAVIEQDVSADGCLCWSCGRDAHGVETSSGWIALSYARA